MKPKKSKGRHKPRSKPWPRQTDREITTPLLRTLQKTYGENPLERDVFGRREATAQERERTIFRQKEF